MLLVETVQQIGVSMSSQESLSMDEQLAVTVMESLLNTSSSDLTSTQSMHMPRETQFNGDSVVSVVTYSVLFCFAAIGNLLVFLVLVNARVKHHVSQVSVFIMHLTLADMIVTFVMIPMEIGWHATVSWKAGDLACRVLMVFRTFGFYLGSLILIAISVDRYLAIAHPTRFTNTTKRAKFMIVSAWVFGFIASIPQVSDLFLIHS